MRTPLVVALFLSGLLPGALVAQESAPGSAPAAGQLPPPLQDPFLERLVGTWKVSNQVGPVTFEGTIAFEWALNHQFVRTTERTEGPAGSYEAEWFWRPADGKILVWWFDSWSNSGSAGGSPSGDELILNGVDPAAGPFRIAIRFAGPDEFSTVTGLGPDETGAFKENVRGTFRRTKPGAPPPATSSPASRSASRPVPRKDAWLDYLAGRWSGPDRIEETGRSMEKAFTAEWALDSRFLRVRFEAFAPRPAPPYEALAYWGVSPDGALHTFCSFDVFGEVAIYAGQAEGEELSLASDDSKYGVRHVVFRRKGPDECVCVREQDRDRTGALRKVAEAVYRRKR
jgi:hypothetical protein